MKHFRVEINWGQGFQTVNNPRNIEELMIQVLFTNRHPSATLSGLLLEWAGDEAVKFNQWKNSTIGGVGPYEGPQYKLYHCNGLLFSEGFIHLSSLQTLWDCDIVIAPLWQFGRADWLSWRCRALSFDYLASLPVGEPGRVIPAIDYKQTPYTVTKHRTRAEQITLFLTLLGLAIQIYDTICKIGQLIDEMIGDATSTAATLGAMIATLLADLLKIILYIAYLLAVILAFITLLLQIISYYFQLKKYKLCMTFEAGFKRLCEKLGMAFSSTILQQGKYKGFTWMPRKNVMPDPSNPLNIFKRPANESISNPKCFGYYEGSCEQFIMDAETFFDAEIVILTNPSTGQLTLHFENRFFFNNISSLSIPNTGDIGYAFNYPGPYTTNLDELPSRMFVEFPVDGVDENTSNRYEGTTISCTVSPLVVNNELCVSHQDGKIVTFPAARALPKLYLNEVETILNTVFSQFGLYTNTGIALVNAIVSVMNGIVNTFGGSSASSLPNLQSFTPISARINWLELSSDDTGLPKVFIGYDDNGEWKIHPNNQLYCTASSLANDFHFKNLATRGNQQLVFKNKKFPFCCEQYLKIMNGNIITCPDGGLGKLVSLKWNVQNEEAVEVEWRKFVTITNNLQETIVIDGA